MREASRVGGISSGGFSLFDGCSGCDLADVAGGDILLGLIVVFIAVFVVWFVARWIYDLVQRRRQQLRARGASREPLAPRPTGCTGTIVSREPLLTAPVGARPCLAFGLAITHHDRALRRGPQTMLRDGATLGFEVELDSGGRARIPAGPCTLDMTTATPTRPSPALDDYLRTIDPWHGRADDLAPFPCDHADVVTLAPGDRVEILSPVTSIADASIAPVTYREAATIVVPDGPVRLRPIAARNPSADATNKENWF